MAVDSPLVSVWMITYNHGPYIRQALESVFSQKVDFDFEVVIGDDCSMDDTRKIILEFEDRYPEKLRKLFHPHNIGMIPNQNAVFAACRGQYIAMLEGDDFWTDDEKLSIQLDAMQRHPECDISFHPCRETRRGRRTSWYGDYEHEFNISQVIRGGGYFAPTPSLMLKRSVVEKLPEFLNDAPAGDYYLQILGSVRGGMLYIPRLMCAYRVQSSSSWSKSVRVFDTRQQFRHRTIDTMEKLDEYLSYEFHDAFEERKNGILLLTATDHLKNGEEDKFNFYLDKVTASPVKKSKKYWLLRSLRRFPSSLIIVMRLWLVIREVRARIHHFLE